MGKFFLIQRGEFSEKGKYLTGEEGVVDLAYMGSAEFEWGAIPKAFRRIMYHFSEYEVCHTDIYTPEHEELMVFCRKECKEEILQAIQEYIEKPYHLKEYSELDKVPNVKKDDTSYNRRRTNFWWCIDNRESGDWMAFLDSHTELFTKAVNNDYQDWWLKKSEKERKAEYEKAIGW